MNLQFLGKRVGILGAGQLARMLAQSGQNLGLDVLIFANSTLDPAVQVSGKSVVGSLSDSKALKDFFQTVDLVIIENEFLPCDLFKQVLGKDVEKMIPAIDRIHQLSNKLEQKKLLTKLKIPTSDYVAAPETTTPKEMIPVFRKKFPKECVLKWSRLGYDGHGVFMVSDWAGQATQITRFIDEALQKGGTVFAESKIVFLRELAMVACRSGKEIVYYSLVESIQKNGVCFLVKGPVDSTKDQKARQSIKKLLEDLDWTGIFAVEFFETKDGELLVNEMAPRVHNTGHYTQNATDTSQFENHWRAALGLPLGSTKNHNAFVMLNLLGVGESKDPARFSAASLSPSSHLHWYGKREMKNGRKMGHINFVGEDSIENLAQKAYAVQASWELENRK